MGRFGNITRAFYCYSTGQVTVPANNVPAQPQIIFSNDSDFVLKEIRNTTQTAGDILITLSFSSGENFSSSALESSIISQNYPIHFDEEVKIPANSQLNIRLQNTTGADIVHEVQLWGFKVDKNMNL